MEIPAIDMHVMTWANQHRSAFLDVFFTTVTWAGSLFVLLPLTIILTGYLLVNEKKEAIFLLGPGFVGVVLFTYLLKAVFKRPRPDIFEPLIAVPADFSFPSAHTVQITAFCLCLLIIFGKDRFFWTGILFLASVVLIGCVSYSRVYLQVHFATDVIAGILLPIPWIVGIAFLTNYN
jgi:membrane-associated phospholipid phosphatase